MGGPDGLTYLVADTESKVLVGIGGCACLVLRLLAGKSQHDDIYAAFRDHPALELASRVRTCLPRLRPPAIR